MNDNLLYNETLRTVLPSIEYAKYRIYKDKNDYFAYNLGIIENISEEQELEMKVLSLLEQLGYSFDEFGTFFYKNIIVKVIKELNYIDMKKVSINEGNLISKLKNHYSKFYIDIAEKDLNINIEIFHSSIEQAISKIDNSKVNYTLMKKVYKNNYKDIDYREQAIVFGKII